MQASKCKKNEVSGTMIPMKEAIIGNIHIKDPVCLAPMAGTSSVTFRGICHEQGAAYAPTELVSARSIVYNGLGRSYRYMQIDPEHEGITCIQLFGNDPGDFAKAVRTICSDPVLGQVDIIDINMGCPVPKVVKTGAGSALLKTPSLAYVIVKDTVRAAEEFGKPVTVKTRIGFSSAGDDGIELAKRVVDAGASMLCVHGRTAVQMYGGKADMEAVARMRDAVKDSSAAFFANGDIKDAESAARALEITGADGLMVGRAAMGDPWIFGRIKAGLNGEKEPQQPTPAQRCDMLLRELEGTVAQIGEATGVKEMRSVMPHYISGLRGSAAVKVRLCSASTVEEVREILEDSRKLWE